MSDFSYNTSKVSMDRGSNFKVPEGWHKWRIIQAKSQESKKGNPMVVVVCEIIQNPELVGKKLTHYVNFLPPENKGAGMSVHFLKTIGQPWEGEVDITAFDWEGATFMGKTKDEPYTKDGKTYTSSKIVDVKSIDDTDDIPF